MAEQPPNGDEEPKDWEGYFSYRSQLEHLRVQQVTAFDSSIVNLASGALGLSVVLLTALAAFMRPVHIWVLFVAWIVFVLCIIANLVSYQTGAKAAEVEMAALDRGMRGESPAANPKWKTVTLFLNRSVVSLFPIGSIFLLVFAALNAMAVSERQVSPAAKPAGEQTNNQSN
ncbi:hypothetical protein [Mesorhizobium sp. 1B3]|uniref:hypothetical protein n=1 Tax=Mesorhizobium sp. 1B3 TaxID=3243599 RepID=UPI003D9980D0